LVSLKELPLIKNIIRLSQHREQVNMHPVMYENEKTGYENDNQCFKHDGGVKFLLSGYRNFIYHLQTDTMQ
jgi:hypothetical protein